MPFNTTWNEFAQPNVTGFAQAMDYANSVTEGLFASGIVMSLFIILFLIFRRWGDMEGFVVASFISSIIASLFRTMGQVSDLFFISLLMIFSLSIILVFAKRKR